MTEQVIAVKRCAGYEGCTGLIYDSEGKSHYCVSCSNARPRVANGKGLIADSWRLKAKQIARYKNPQVYAIYVTRYLGGPFRSSVWLDAGGTQQEIDEIITDAKSGIIWAGPELTDEELQKRIDAAAEKALTRQDKNLLKKSSCVYPWKLAERPQEILAFENANRIWGSASDSLH